MTDSTNPLPGFLQMIVAGVARHFLTTIAGGLAASGYVSHDQQTQMITGGAAVIVWAAGVGWSIAQKKTVAAQAVQAAPARLGNDHVTQQGRKP